MSTSELHWFTSGHSSGPEVGDRVETAVVPATRGRFVAHVSVR
ncbi:hypothetical protein [Streptomyces sp. NPDC097610]